MSLHYRGECMSTEMKTELICMDKIIPYARNPRNNQNAIDWVAASIKEFGFKQPIVVDKEFVIVAGHTRYEAAKKLGMTDVPVWVATDLTPQQIKAYRIADNKVASMSSFNNDMLALEFKDLQDANYDLINTAFTEAEIADVTLERELGKTNAYDEWEGMPDYDQEHGTTYRTLTVSFRNEEDVQEFAKLMNQKLTEKTRSLWYPEKTEVYEDGAIEWVSDEE